MKKRLTAAEYHVLREKGTEPPFTGQYLHETRAGSYACKVCGNVLFDSSSKFESGTGWPSFDRSVKGSVRLREDASHGLKRVEVTCAKCGSHLGHLFSDGPTETGERYCINSICMNLKPK